MRGVRRSVGHNVFNFELLQGEKQTGFTRKICAVSCHVIPVVGMVVALPHPDRLLGQLLGRLQVGGIQLFGNHIIVRIQRRGFLVGLRGIFHPLGIALVYDVGGPDRSHCNH